MFIFLLPLLLSLEVVDDSGERPVNVGGCVISSMMGISSVGCFLKFGLLGTAFSACGSTKPVTGSVKFDVFMEWYTIRLGNS